MICSGMKVSLLSKSLFIPQSVCQIDFFFKFSIFYQINDFNSFGELGLTYKKLHVFKVHNLFWHTYTPHENNHNQDKLISLKSFSRLFIIAPSHSFLLTSATYPGNHWLFSNTRNLFLFPRILYKWNNTVLFILGWLLWLHLLSIIILSFILARIYHSLLLILSSIDGHLAITKTASINIYVKIFALTCAFNSLEILSSRITVSYDMCMYNFLRNWQIVFQSGYVILLSQHL